MYGSDVLDGRLANLEEAEISPAARAMLPLLQTFTLRHEALGPEDFAEVHALEIGDEAIRDAFYVAYLFNIINRMADALRFEIGSQADFDKSTTSLLGRGYR